jgi:c-di-GMP-binding flagellar brake protein YcgR
MHLHPFPEPDAPELERYTLYGRGEILAALRHLCEARTMVTAYFGGDGQFAVSMALQVNPDFDEVVFDLPADPAAQERLFAAHSLVFVAFQDNVKMQFEAPVAQQTAFEGRPAFRVRMPAALLRLQRREYFRVATPEKSRPTCLVPSPGAADRYESLQVLNLSVGGLAVMSYPHYGELPVGAPIDACFLDLPGIGTVPVRIRVVHVAANDETGREIGCEFLDLSPQARLMLQRYVNRVEAEQRRSAMKARESAT